MKPALFTRPTRALLCGRIITDGKVGARRVTGATWISNGHWAVRAERFATDPMVFTGTEIIHKTVADIERVTRVFPGRPRHAVRLEGRVAETSKGKMYRVEYAAGDVLVWVDGAYFDWLNRPGIEWCKVADRYAPLEAYSDDELVAVVMPCRAPIGHENERDEL